MNERDEAMVAHIEAGHRAIAGRPTFSDRMRAAGRLLPKPTTADFASLEPGIELSVEYAMKATVPPDNHDHWADAMQYLMMAPKDVTSHAELEKVMVDAKQAIQDACGLSIRDGTGVVVASFDLAGNAVFNTVFNTVPAAAMYEANDWQSAEQAKAFDWARPSDRDGIEEELRRELRGVPIPMGKPVPVDTTKPALPALGVTASGDHRFGLWRTIE